MRKDVHIHTYVCAYRRRPWSRLAISYRRRRSWSRLGTWIIFSRRSRRVWTRIFSVPTLKRRTHTGKRTNVASHIKYGARDPGHEGIKTGVRNYQNRGTRVSKPGYEGIKTGVRGYQNRGTKVSKPGYSSICPLWYSQQSVIYQHIVSS